jgi:hypothetical protein
MQRGQRVYPKRKIIMLWNRGEALLAACLGSLLLSSLAHSQVQWKTSLNPPPEPVALSQQLIASAPDGAIFSVAVANGNRIRVSRTTANGAVSWARQVAGVILPQGKTPLIHPDSSVSVFYRGSAEPLCVVNFLAAGNVRSNYCFADDQNYTLASIAPDGDLIIASGLNRTIRKFSPDGTNRWTSTEGENTYGEIRVGSFDSDGNYFEIQDTRLRRWRATDGLRVAGTYLANYQPSNFYSVTDSKLGVARNNTETVVVSGVMDTSNAVTAILVRYGSNGVARWTRNLIFAGYNSTADAVGVYPAPSDDVYVVRTPSIDGDSEIARVSASGAIVWQRHYARISRVVNSSTGLLAIRSDVTSSGSNSYVFPIAALDGALGAPTIYSRADSFAPNTWFAATGGVIAAFEANNFFPPYAPFPTDLQASNTFIGVGTPNRWITTAELAPDASIAQSDCLMPRLGLSSPATRWARSQPANSSSSRWVGVIPTSGEVSALASEGSPGCGYPITADGGRVAIGGAARATKLSASGATVWQTPSTTYPQSYANSPLQAVSANDETTYTFGSLLGRVSTAGTILFETETLRANQRYLAVDSANHAWLVSTSSGAQGGFVSKVSPTGVLLWSTAIDTPACNDVLTAARLTTSDEMLVATQSCGEGRVFKVNASGIVVWQRVASGTAQRPYLELKALHRDASGNIYAGGCLSSPGGGQNARNAASIVTSWTTTGVERWSTAADLITGAPECVTSITTDSSNNVFASTSSTEAMPKPVLWALNDIGAERWRHSSVLASPNAADTEMTMDSATTLIALGEAPPNFENGRVVTMRKINVAVIGSTLRLKFLEVPTTLIGYREPFAVRIGLRSASDVAINATIATQVEVGLENGTGKLEGSLTCTIAIGANECTVNDVRYDVIENGVTLSAASDGLPAAISSAIGFKRAATTTALSARRAAPYTSYSVIRVRASAQSVSPTVSQRQIGQINGPFASSFPFMQNCTYVNLLSALATVECDFVVRFGGFPITAEYFGGFGNYENSAASSLTLPVTKVMPLIDVVADPDNSYVAGDRLRFRVGLRANGFNVIGVAEVPTLSVTGGNCSGRRVNGDLNNGYAGSYMLCEISTSTAGSVTINFDFPGDDDLLPAAQVSRTVAINAGAVLRSTYNLPFGVNACSPTPNVTCITLAAGGGWQCVGPAGMSGSVFFVPLPGSPPYFTNNAPVQYANVSGVVQSNDVLPFGVSSNSCNLDVDGDGARLAMTDGMLILRRMLGISGPALTAGATHACVPRTASGIAAAISLTTYDIDGDGFTKPETDGVLLLRAMLGFTGEALIANAISPTATRKTATNVENWFRYTCNLASNLR